MSHAKSPRYFVILAFFLVVCALTAQAAKVSVNVTPALDVINHAVVPQMFLANAAPLPEGAGSHGGGRLEIKGVKGSDSVYLNGKGKDFYAGTVKDTRTKDLVLPPGLQHVILVDPDGDKQVYSAYVEIKPGQKATLHVETSSIAYENWAGGPVSVPPVTGTVSSAGSSSSSSDHYVQTSYPVVTGTFNAPKTIPCGDKARLVWNTNGAYSMMKAYGKSIYSDASGSGELLVDPGADGTTYILESFGPGGEFISNPQTVRVNKEVHATLTASPGVMHYRRVGDKVIEDPEITLNWTAENADSVRIDPIGPVTGTSGQQVVKYTPTKTDFGPIDETRMYSISASNPCGGTYTSTASVQVAGSIDPEIVAQALPPVLPKTGSPLPLIALLGFGSMVSGLIMRMVRKG